MFKIDTTDATVIEPARPTAGTPKFFSAAAKTIVTDWWLNMMQNEIYNTLLRFGITPSKTNDQQSVI